MADQLSRLEQNRTLYMRGSRQQLMEIISKSNLPLVVGSITKAIKLQIITEEIAREQGVEINDEAIAEYAERNWETLEKEVERSLSSFIRSLVSQEGG
ncbi:MAG: hypothetical protein P9X24_12900 [Candidatus Hatepunaea meridiana]|nr:hypothetical protein [Candidatus Hatepunaea meridiana]